MKKETAIEWLIKQLYNHEHHIDILDVATINGYFDAAKQMEKEQIIQSFRHGAVHPKDYIRIDSVYREEAEKYYNKTYK